MLPDRGLEGRVAGEQGLGPGERLEGRFVVVQAIALELAQAEQGLGLAPRQAEIREAALRALVGGDAGAARLRFLGPAQRVAAGQLRLRRRPPAVRRGGPPLLGQPETARPPRTGRASARSAARPGRPPPNGSPRAARERCPGR